MDACTGSYSEGAHTACSQESSIGLPFFVIEPRRLDTCMREKNMCRRRSQQGKQDTNPAISKLLGDAGA